MELDSDERTRAELLADAAVAKDHAARFKRAATMIDDDLVQSALRARARELETLGRAEHARSSLTTFERSEATRS